jgi:hypothetical protein
MPGRRAARASVGTKADSKFTKTVVPVFRPLAAFRAGSMPVESMQVGTVMFRSRRRLRLHEIIEGIPKTHRYRLTDLGLRTA